MESVESKPKTYFKRELLLLKIFGADIAEEGNIFYKVYAAIHLTVFLGYPFIVFGDLFKHDFDVVSDLLIYQMCSSMAATEFTVTILNLKKIKQLLYKLEEEPFTPNFERGGKQEVKLIKRCISVTRIQALICWGLVMITIGLATIITLRKRIRSSDYHDWEFTYGPITVLNVTYSPNYEITWAYQIIGACAVGFNHCTVNLIMAGIMAHSSVQLKVLQNNLRRIIENAYAFMMKDMSGDRNVPNANTIHAVTIPWKYLKKSLDTTILYHIKIIEIAHEVDEIFSTLTFSVFSFTLGAICFFVYRASVLEINSVRMVKIFTDSTTVSIPVLLLCYWSQEVVFESQQVARAAFEANFVGADLRFQKGLNLITVRSLRPIQLKAGKVLDISLATFVSILKTSYSAFMVLRKVNMEVK